MNIESALEDAKMLSDKEGARLEVEELTAKIKLMASFVGAQFIADQRKTETFIAAREQRRKESTDRSGSAALPEGR